MFAQTYSAHASLKEGDKFGDWIVGCEKDNKGKKLCFLNREL
jgi:invasion protein IalB